VVPKTRHLRNALVAIATVLMSVPISAQSVPPEAQRISLQIATGPASGSYIKVGEAVARIINHPPELARCDVQGVCGPYGLIVTLRSSSGSVANAFAVNTGRVRSAIIQGDVAAAAYEGRGPFQQTGPLKNLRAVARLHEETLHLVAAPRSRIRRLSDIAGKRVSIDGPRSATNYTVRQLFAAARIDVARVKLSFEPADQAAEALRMGELDAFFVIGVAPVGVVDALVRRRQGRLVALDAKPVSVLTGKSQIFAKHVLPADTYRSSVATATLNVATLWVVQKSLPDAVVRDIVRSLWNPANKRELARLGSLAKTMDAAKAGENLPLPLHPGAARFYADAGR
jgi:TRAP transporter TAXI family solute receptor